MSEATVSDTTTPLPRLLYTVPEVAQMLALSVRTVNDLLASGDLPCRRIGRSVRFAQADLDCFIARYENLPYA